MNQNDIVTADNDVRYVKGNKTSFCGLAHETRYNWILEEWDIKNKTVLDFGCGSGYGSYMLAKKAGLVIGVDNSPKSIAFANEEYHADNIKYFTLDASSLEAITGFDMLNAFDFIVSFDVIEHIERYFDFLENVVRLLKTDGYFILSCPNRLQTFNWNRIWNPFHFQEFSPYQLRKILALYFKNIQLYAQDFKDPAKRELERSLNLESYVSRKGISKKVRRITKKIRALFQASGNNGYSYSDMVFLQEPSWEILEKAFGLLAVCRNI